MCGVCSPALVKLAEGSSHASAKPPRARAEHVQTADMALNTWWDKDPDQRYWMEVATTGSMGEILIAPKFPGASWSYDLVGEVRAGDRILHWQSGSAGRGLVGWSVATADPEVVPEYTWQPRGTAGRSLPGPRTTEGWMVTLGGINRFQAPVMTDELQGLMDPIVDVASKLEAEHGKPTYFPFYVYGGRELRAQQGYLVKFPAELFEVLPNLTAAKAPATARAEAEIAEESLPPNRSAPRGSVTRVQDPELRSAIENHAVDRAIEHYEGVGGADFLKLGKPYDLRLTLNDEERHVEVKGSSLLIETVELTINEVTHAGTFQPTDLVVVDGINYDRTPEGITTSGGRLRIWRDWKPLDKDLAARKFAYALPSTSPRARGMHSEPRTGRDQSGRPQNG